MYAQAPLGFTKEHLHDFRVALNQALLGDMKNNKENVINAVLNVEIMNKSNLYQFQVRYFYVLYIRHCTINLNLTAPLTHT